MYTGHRSQPYLIIKHCIKHWVTERNEHTLLKATS